MPYNESGNLAKHDDEIFVVDAFSEQVFEGNPAGVCIMEQLLINDLWINAILGREARREI
ncbi:PhzF family phenazine biosynthesis protein [Mesobacillus maritimus]|uniref:PhzF family phenazine biosynthesis protein n=1 Tax=Mesobacillus maritimus TaxID=1643336 RepID=UPI0020407523|nr:PhzF family phenazine biosynthesis protein [Mesobacillus maritimus]MCM3588384.1 PhzF family phenazine biosynthesis protein [Mesobacillus maritimus]